ncbi:MAG: vitamin K epoxide reductase family protein [Candidatus Saccharimonadales bacterium]
MSNAPVVKITGYRSLFITMLVFGVIGLIVSFILSVEEFKLLKNPSAVLSCSINAVLDCSGVMKTWQASLFGFPNMFIGLMAFPVVITTAVVALCGVTLPRLFWRMATIGFGLGLVFSYWLFFSSLYVIEILCPWCLVITLSTTILFETVLRYGLRENIFNFTTATQKRIKRLLDQDFDKFVTASWLMVLIVLVYLKFGSNLFM